MKPIKAVLLGKVSDKSDFLVYIVIHKLHSYINHVQLRKEIYDEIKAPERGVVRLMWRLFHVSDVTIYIAKLARVYNVRVLLRSVFATLYK